MTEDRWHEIFYLTLHLYLKTWTGYLTAETWEPKVFLPPANYPVSGFPLSAVSCLW